MKRIVVFDICDTLYYSNTTHDFVRFVAASDSNMLHKFVFFLFNGKVSPFRYLLIVVSIISGFDALRKINVYLLRDRTREQLTLLANEFVSAVLEDRRIIETHRKLRDELDLGSCVILCSASVEPVVEAIARQLRVSQYVSSTLDYRNERMTGRIKDDVTSRKLALLRESGLCHEPDLAVSDNKSDIGLLIASGEGVVVLHNTRDLGFWEGHGFSFIDLHI